MQDQVLPSLCSPLPHLSAFIFVALLIHLFFLFILYSSNFKVMALKQRGIRAEFLGSAQTDPTVRKNAESGIFHVLFMTPEKACSTPSR